MTYRSRNSVTIQRPRSIDLGSPVESLCVRLEKLESAGIRQSRASALASARNAAALRRLGYVNSKIARLLQSDGERRECLGTLRRHCLLFNRITRLRELSEFLQHTERAHVSVHEGAYVYSEDVDDQLIVFRFECEPEKGTAAMLRRAGFRPDAEHLRYTRRLSDKAATAAKQIRKHLKRSFH